MALNDLECPIHKVRFMDGALDVRTLWLLDSTIRIRVTRGAEGEWAGGLSPSPSCGQLTRCFSAVAELLVHHMQDHAEYYRSRILSRPLSLNLALETTDN